jgi:RNA polymerase sigma factor (sigma-70 family)
MTTATAGRTDRQLLTDFAAGKDEEAFAELVRRHGPMVLGVCRQMLRHEQDAEDAFQATFLVLARKAGAVRTPEALSGWLYSVATRLAARNRAQAGRRRTREAPLVDTPADEREGEPPGGELWPLLCEEVGHLPERYRIPFVLCYLEGKTNEEAARQLNCPPGTVFSRLARARQRLRQRLGRRGLVVSSGLLAATLSALPQDAFAAVPAQLLRQTVRGAVSFSAGRAASGSGASDRAAKLAAAQVALWGASATKAIIAASLSGALVCTAAGLLVWRAAGENVAGGNAGDRTIAENAVVENAVVEKPIEERLKGTWLLQPGCTFHGELVPIVPAERRGIKLGDNGRMDEGSAYRVDTGKRPMEIDWIINGNSWPGIFKLEGDTLTICHSLAPPDNLPTKPLPTDFTPGPGKAVWVYSRDRR